MTLRKEWDLAEDRQFSERVSMALYHVAREVLDEPPETWGHALRRNLSSVVINGGPETFVRYSALVITDPAIRAIFEEDDNANNNDIEDFHVLDAVRGMWDALSNVSPPPET